MLIPASARVTHLSGFPGCRSSHHSRHRAAAVETALTWFEALGYTVLHESDVISGKHQAERNHYLNGVLCHRLRRSLHRINPTVPFEAIESAIFQITDPDPSPLLVINQRLHRFLLEGVRVSCQVDGLVVPYTVQLIDFFRPLQNDWLVIQPFTVIEGDRLHRPDLILFLNGLPLVIWQGLAAQPQPFLLRSAYLQLHTFMRDLPKLLSYNELLIIADRHQSRIGTLTSTWRQFMPWLTINGEVQPDGSPELETLIQGVFDKRYFLEVLQHLISFKFEKGTLTKKLRRHLFCTMRSPSTNPVEDPIAFPTPFHPKANTDGY